MRSAAPHARASCRAATLLAAPSLSGLSGCPQAHSPRRLLASAVCSRAQCRPPRPKPLTRAPARGESKACAPPQAPLALCTGWLWGPGRLRWPRRAWQWAVAGQRERSLPPSIHCGVAAQAASPCVQRGGHRLPLLQGGLHLRQQVQLCVRAPQQSWGLPASLDASRTPAVAHRPLASRAASAAPRAHCRRLRLHLRRVPWRPGQGRIPRDAHGGQCCAQAWMPAAAACARITQRPYLRLPSTVAGCDPHHAAQHVPAAAGRRGGPRRLRRRQRRLHSCWRLLGQRCSTAGAAAHSRSGGR